MKISNSTFTVDIRLATGNKNTGEGKNAKVEIINDKAKRWL